ncbi:aquaporin [Streptomyces sp. HNM0663]|uniref:Aquaporin n=1 Tax=Streptomyces chengmaiensis TaxID=3040919 RepID=A0ABT6HMV6_9ACTN|nr:aquaporin [Streptomyces chengmaiensis]MDH2389627.1 aquaporin [Streptomyces chengmaiensis]
MRATPDTPETRPLRLRTALYECALTTGTLFAVVTAARWTALPDSPLSSVLSTPESRLAAMALMVGAIVTTVLGPAMRRGTAGHLNPAVTLALWLLRVFPGRAVAPFVAAQLTGSLAGVALARLVWGEGASQIGYAALAPSPDWHTGAVFLAEAGCMTAIMLIVAIAIARPRLAARLPLLIGASVAAVIYFFGPLSGGGVNPARQLGPALLSGRTDLLWVYLAAPVVGAVLAAGISAALRPSASVRQAEPAATAAAPEDAAPVSR